MTGRRSVTAWALFAAFALAPGLAAQGNSKGKGKDKHENAQAVRFGSHDIEVITGYYGSTGNLPPGLAKRGGDLPPGLEKQLRRNGQLPPGLQKRLEPFPVELERQLTAVPTGCRRVVVGTTAMLIQDATNLILDIIQLAKSR